MAEEAKPAEVPAAEPAPAAAAPAPEQPAAPAPAKPAAPAPAKPAAPAPAKPAAPAPAKPAAPAPAKPAAPAPAEPAAPAPAEPAAPAAPAAAGGLELVNKVEESWESDGCQFQKYSSVITNKGAAQVNGVAVELANIAGLEQQWECTVLAVGDGKPALLGLPEHVSGLAPGASHTMGFIIKKAASGEPAITVKAT